MFLNDAYRSADGMECYGPQTTLSEERTWSDEGSLWKYFKKLRNFFFSIIQINVCPNK